MVVITLAQIAAANVLFCRTVASSVSPASLASCRMSSLCFMVASVASLFYLRHSRVCAACATNVRSTSSSPIAVLCCSPGVDFLLDVAEVLGFMLSFCLTIAWDLMSWSFATITPAEFAACACLVRACDTGVTCSGCTDVLPVLLAVFVLHAAAAEAHLSNIGMCRWLSLAVVEALCPGSALAVAAFIWPTFGKDIGAKRSMASGVRKRPACAHRMRRGSDRVVGAASSHPARGFQSYRRSFSIKNRS